jgi:hypothetical protein
VRERYSTPVQTGPAAHLAYYTMGTGPFPGVKWPGRGVEHPPHLVPRLKTEQIYTTTPPMGFRGLSSGEINFNFVCLCTYLAGDDVLEVEKYVRNVTNDYLLLTMQFVGLNIV